ncbi:MAG: hypothetical protein ACR2NP_23260 [Pirellulaceae bacterium]
MDKMGKEATCDWCGEWIYFITRDGRQTPMQNGKPHRCRDHAVGSRFSVGTRRREMAESHQTGSSQVRTGGGYPKKADVKKVGVNQRSGFGLLPLIFFAVLFLFVGSQLLRLSVA